ncbi:hypothetical protein [Psychroserpens mesophilus]|uniref:hypothetical protein n=1 Tax=Psychroserpens mesophilus TaxID=325473 RepID=UPI003D64F782
MIWILLIIGIIGFVLYNFFRDKDQMLKRQVDMQGGMAKKYEFLVGKLTQEPSAKVVKVTRDQIHIRAEGQTTATNFIITETFNKTEIEWIGQMAMLGKHNHKWTYPHNYPQQKMLDEIGEYMEWKSNQMFN